MIRVTRQRGQSQVPVCLPLRQQQAFSAHCRLAQQSRNTFTQHTGASNASIRLDSNNPSHRSGTMLACGSKHNPHTQPPTDNKGMWDMSITDHTSNQSPALALHHCMVRMNFVILSTSLCTTPHGRGMIWRKDSTCLIDCLALQR
jgi:hypothetical protein